MATTQVILTTNIRRLGGEGDIVKVRPGFARNFLIPSGNALPVTKFNMRQLDNLRKKRAEREAQEINKAQEIAKKLSKLQLSFTLKIGAESKAFGSVSSADIQTRLKEEGFELERRQVRIEKPIKSLGKYEVTINLHQDVIHTITIEVVTDAPAPVATQDDKKEKGAKRPEKATKTDKPVKKATKKKTEEEA